MGNMIDTLEYAFAVIFTSIVALSGIAGLALGITYFFANV